MNYIEPMYANDYLGCTNPHPEHIRLTGEIEFWIAYGLLDGLLDKIIINKTSVFVTPFICTSNLDIIGIKKATER